MARRGGHRITEPGRFRLFDDFPLPGVQAAMKTHRRTIPLVSWSPSRFHEGRGGNALEDAGLGSHDFSGIARIGAVPIGHGRKVQIGPIRPQQLGFQGFQGKRAWLGNPLVQDECVFQYAGHQGQPE